MTPYNRANKDILEYMLNGFLGKENISAKFYSQLN